MDPLALRAYTELYGEPPRHDLQVRYHGRFTGYNGRITRYAGRIVFALSRKFEESSDEIRIGVMQQLLNRLNKTKKRTLEIELYTSFLKKMTDFAETTKVDAHLKERFDVLNKEYFDGFMLTPNLVWGTRSLTKLGHYTFATDTVSLSTALKEDPEMLDYVLYHELLHKKHKFDEKPGGGMRSHTAAFRADERKFRLADGSDPEKRLEAFVRRARRATRGAGARPVARSRRSLLKSILDYF